jgi:hypothetical protein
MQDLLERGKGQVRLGLDAAPRKDAHPLRLFARRLE